MVQLARFLALALLLLLAAGATPTLALDPIERDSIERDLFRAKRTHEFLRVAARYAELGYPQQAKQIVDRAARVAATAREWTAVARAYHRLGYTENAQLAARRAREAGR